MRALYNTSSTPPTVGHLLQAFNPTVSSRHKNTDDCPMTEVDELKKNFRAIQEENYKLQAVITDVTEVNKRWQKYNNDRQMYVQRLLSTIQDQQEQMNKIVESRAFPMVHQVTPDDHKNIEDLQAENALLKEDLSKLQKRLERLEQEHREHVEVLEFQVKAHRDDWEAECSEKQQALRDKAAMELQVKELQKDIRSLKHKLKDERSHKQPTHCVHCCVAHVCEASHCSMAVVGKHCHRDNPKTYRTSVHLPCTSGHVLSKGTTVYFGDDLVTDGDEAVAEDLDKTALSDSELPRSRSSSSSPPPLSTYEEGEEGTQHKAQSDGNNNLPHNVKARSANSEAVGRAEKALELNIVPEDSSEHEYKYSVHHISPNSSDSNLTADDKTVDSSASGVTIGFSSGGLASVTSFSQRPVVKSSSLPISEKLSFNGEYDAKPASSLWSLDSGLSSVVGPPMTYNNFTTKGIFEEKSFKMLSSGNLTKSENNVTATNVRKASVPWKANYFEEGVATQTREDVVCPGCGQVFPPRLHLKFLDHFEMCQNNVKDTSKRISNVKLRN
ncbi:hypothetical protein B7P43_G00993 [Cryptotermes secundus]|uniref:Uncharacterized protein n=1 Tax=Cryptotermes secundus TaxID=105785 RepID=A0A2J7PG91_9NEOP|nr:uncharacterized protein LOC111874219 isoform X3 [Cryptotermes secundus]PNF15350.1 hypothetical protein B7P43_G00993 [Cryptotermes secundus]